MRFRKKKSGRRRSTNVIRMKFQSFIDISTSATSMQIFTISAGGSEILKRLAPQFSAYKYYKIGKISVKLVPASTLPVDPTGLSISTGDNLVDPRDQLTPGLMRITNGEDVFEDISGLSDDQQHAIYNNMLLDPRWFKWMLQSGVKRYAYPRYWQIGQLHQDKWPGMYTNVPYISQVGNGLEGTAVVSEVTKQSTGDFFHSIDFDASSPYGFFQTGHRGTLGWLPTDGLQPVKYFNGEQIVDTDFPLLASPPEVEVMKIIMPKAYKTRYWYRAFITEEVLFKEPIVNFGIPYTTSGGSTLYYRPLDVFHQPGVPTPTLPSTGSVTTWPGDDQTGGNYGDD